MSGTTRPKPAGVSQRAGLISTRSAPVAGLVGTVGEVVDRLKVYEAMGVSRFYMQLQDLRDMDQLDLVAEHVMPNV